LATSRSAPKPQQNQKHKYRIVRYGRAQRVFNACLQLHPLMRTQPVLAILSHKSQVTLGLREQTRPTGGKWRKSATCEL
jgi:hypothetical protein